MKLESIYKTKTNQNFDAIIKALSYFDAILSGATLHDHSQSNLKAEHVSLLTTLLDLELNDRYITVEDHGTNAAPFDPYIISIFKAFIKTKGNIILNYEELMSENAINIVVDWIMYKFAKSTDNTVQRYNDKKNLFKPQLLDLFSNVKSITLITNRYDNDDEYGEHSLHSQRSISMLSLLSIIKNTTSLEKIVVLSYGSEKQYYHNSWQEYLWEMSSTQLKNKFNDSNYEIQLQYAIGPEHEYHGFVITQK